MNGRIKKIRHFLKEEKIGCLLVDSPLDILYILNIEQSFNYVELNFLLLITQEKLFFISNPLSLSFIKPFLPEDIEIIESETEPYIKNHSRYKKEVGEIIKSEKIERFAVTSAQYIDVSSKCIGIKNPIPTIAAVKTKKECEYIRKSSSILQNVYNKVKENIVTGCGEIELRNSIDIELHREGAERRAFPTKVAFGEKTANIFPVSTMNRLKDNDIIFLDMGCIYKGYRAEMARTIFHGKKDAKKREIYNIVLSAYKKMKEFLKPGIVASEVDGIVREYFKEMGHSQFFFHPLGESTGIVSGGISLAPYCQDVIQPGMVFVVEPALYLPNWGCVKFKETILVKEDGIEELTGGPEEDE